MPIRRSAGAQPKEDPNPAPTPEKDPKASSGEASSEAEGQEALAPATPEGDERDGEGEKSAENAPGGKREGEDGEKPTKGEKSESGGAEEQGKKKKKKDGIKKEDGAEDKGKKMKRTIPAWATMSASKLAVTPKTVSLSQPKVEEVLLDAIQNCKERTGASVFTIMKYVTKKYSTMEMDKRTKSLYKRALKRLVEKGAVKQLKGKGFSGSFTIGKVPTNSKQSAMAGVKGTLGEALPLIMTRLCEPKEASYILIKKYLEQHFPQLNVENRPDVLKNCLQRAVEKGYLEQITGKGASGTFQLKKSGNKVLLGGGLLEDAIVAAITAMNEPKCCSISTLRKFLVESYKDQNIYLLLANLKRTLQRCKMMGWMEQITGHGLSGTYQLSYPYYPSPGVLIPEMMEKLKQKEAKKLQQQKRRTQQASDSEEESDEDEEEDSEDEEPPPPKRAQKRPAPKGRQPPPRKKAKPSSRKPARAKKPAAPSRKLPAAAAKAAAASRKAPPPPKATPIKKAPPPKATPVKKAPPAKATPVKKAPPAKPTPVKKAAPARTPKTPVVKKMTSRVSKRSPPKKSPAKKQAAPSAVKSKTASRKSLRAKK
ncbi:heterochromatin protein 1-binding protein 3 isoform X2 [Electrophorus electricus]|uniref:heterochromatin protein 1-binding protein 3 isoform X2 n=1 Tax=Electrophorus electricus TaxID=8005 RepID=UPI0015D06AEE|nr:heterochromatin protein 1-binding protein 3 isoform X2 [Electrophorus electricus]